MKRGKIIGILLIVVMAFSAFAMTGCGKKSDVTLKVFTMFGGEDPLKGAYQKGVTAFKTANPKVSIEDESVQAAEGFDNIVKSKFVVEKNAPDVMYVFSPGRNQAIQSKLAKVSDIRKDYPDYGKGFPEVGGDPQTLAFLGNSFGFYYKKADFQTTDFANYGALKTKLSAIGKTNVVNPAGEPHYWFNYIGLQKMGKKWADVQIPDKAWFTTNKTELIGVLDELKAYLVDGVQIEQSATIQYGDEKQKMWNGEKSFDVNGNWNAAGFYPPNSTVAGTAAGYDFRSMVFDDNTATADIDESKYVMSGFFHGWMISKRCFEDKAKLKAAVDFINTQCANVGEYGGMAANGAIAASDTDIAKSTKAVLKIEGAIFCSPLDDKFLNATAQSALYQGLTGLLRGTMTSTAVIDAAIAAYPA